MGSRAEIGIQVSLRRKALGYTQQRLAEVRWLYFLTLNQLRAHAPVHKATLHRFCHALQRQP